MLQPVLKKTTRGVLRGIFGESVVLPEMTPIFEGLTTFAEFYSTWQPSGSAWEIEIQAYHEGFTSNRVYIDGSASGYVSRVIQYESGGVKGLEVWSQDPDNQQRMPNAISSSGNNFEKIVVKSSGEILVNDDIKGTHLGKEMQVSRLGITWNDFWPFKGQIQRIKLLDDYDTGRTEYPVNGRDVVGLDGLTQYGEIPVAELEAGDVIEFDFVLNDATNESEMLIDGRSLPASPSDGFLIISNAGGDSLVFAGYEDLLVDGAPYASGEFKVVAGAVYNIKVSGGTGKLRVVGNSYLYSQALNGFVANLRINGNNINRYYPLDRADIIQATPVLQEVPIQYDTNGTVTYDWDDDTYFDYLTEIDPKYNDVAPDVNEAQARAAEGLVKNGDFRFGDDGSWTKSAGVTISSGAFLTDGTTSSELARQTGIGIVSGEMYRIELSIKSISQGAVGIKLGGGKTVLFNSTGTYTFYLDDATLDNIQISGISSAIAEISSVSIRKVTSKVVTERTISSEGVFDGNWINAPQEVYRPNNSIDINTVKRSKDAPSVDDNLLINSLGSVGEELWDDSLAVVGPSWTLVDVNTYRHSGAFESVTINDVCPQGFVYEMEFEVSGNTGGNLEISFDNFVSKVYQSPDNGLFNVFIFNDTVNDNIAFAGGSFNGTVEVKLCRRTSRNIGEIKNLTGYQPVLKGGGLNRENVPDKFEAFNGDFTSGDWVNGVNTLTNRMTSNQSYGNSGSYDMVLNVPISALDILVGYKGSVLKVPTDAPTTRVDYLVLQGTDEQIQKGFEYPNVFRVIKPTDTSGEYEHYNTGGTYPWKP